MKKLFRFLAWMWWLAVLTTIAVSCGTDEESDDPTASVDTSAASPTPTEVNADYPSEPEAAPESDAFETTTGESGDEALATDVVSLVITAARATLYGGPGKDYPVVGTALGSANYPVTGISKDGGWWQLTCFDESAVMVESCWVSSDPTVAMPTTSTALSSESNIKPYVELTFDFLRAVQSGLTAAGSEPYLSRNLQEAVESGRPLPTLFGVRDAFPSFVLTDFTDPGDRRTAQLRIRFNYDSPNYAIVHLIQEDGDWQIDKVAAHNLVKTFGTDELMQAEGVIISYYEALAAGDSEEAAKYLTEAAQEGVSLQALSSNADGLDRLAVTTMQPVRSSADQLTYYVHLMAEADQSTSAAQNINWQEGENARWLTMVDDGGDWRIANIIRSPLLSDLTSWQRVNILPIDMTLDIPSDWSRAGLQWAWSPNSLGIPGIGVNWTELGEFGGDETMLPRYRREVSRRPVDLGWAQGNQYTFELVGSPGEDSIGAETHMIVRTGRRAYDFHASAGTIEDLDSLQPILQRMTAAVSINDPQASAFNSVETSVNFLATILRDGTGASSFPYLSKELKANLQDRSDLLTELGTDALFESFTATWLENPADGQALVGVTLFFENRETHLIFTVERDATDTWLITEIALGEG